MRVPMQSETGKVTLVELQTALEIVPDSDIYCLAFMSNKRKCDKIPNHSLEKRYNVLVEIAHELARNGPAIASDRLLRDLLDDLATTLICTKKKHELRKDGSPCNQVVHVAEILRVRLERFEDARHARRQMEGGIRYQRPAGRKSKGRASPSDESGGSSSGNEGDPGNNSNDDELSERDDGSATALAYRPRAIPRHQATAKSGQHVFKSVEKTPNRVQQRASGSGRHHHQSDESDASTPGTPVSRLFSTGRSKSSAVTVPTKGPSSSSSRSFLHKQRNETPTKQRRARDATDVESRSDADYVNEEDDSDGSAPSSSSTSHSQAVKHEDSEPEDVLTEDDETPEIMMAFSRRKPSKSYPGTVNHVLNLMRSKINEAPHGYVYCFSTRRASGLLKIGYAGIKEVQEMKPGAKLPIPESDRRARLWKRLETQNKKCKFEMKLEFDVYMPSAAHKMERLIHATLREHNRTVTHCSNPDCTVGHNEWFNVSLRDARHTVEAWGRFSKLRPFSANGHLAEQWYEYAHDHVRKNTFAKLSADVWLDREWKETVVRAGEEKRQRKLARMEKIGMERLEEEVEQAEEGVEQAEEDLEEKRRLVKKAELNTAKVKLGIARWEMNQAEEILVKKKRQLEEKKKRRTSLG